MFAVVCGAASAFPANTGGTVMFTQSLLNIGAQVLVPVVASKVGSLKIPDQEIDESGVTVDLSDMYTHDFACSGCLAIGLTPPDGLSVSVNNFGLQFHAHVEYSWTIISGSCDADVTFTGANIGVSTAFGVTADGHANVHETGASVDLGQMDINFSGGVSAEILQILEGMFDSQIRDSVAAAAKQAIVQLINTNLNQALVTANMNVPLPPHNFSELHLELTAAPTVTASAVTLPTIAAVSGPGIPPAPYPPPALPPAGSPDMFAVYLSSYSLCTALWSYAASGVLAATIAPTDVPPGAPFALNTTDVGVFAPGLAQRYPNMWMQIRLALPTSSTFGGPPTAAVTTTGIVLRVPTMLAFDVLPPGRAPVEVFVVKALVSASANATAAPAPNQAVASVVVRPHLAYATAALSLANSTVGPVDTADLSTAVNGIVTGLVVPWLNGIVFAEGIALPPAPLGIKVTAAQVILGNGFLSVESNFGPSAP